MTGAWSIAVVPLAKAGEAGKAGPIGLAVILLLCIVSYFLFKSMSKHMRKVRENFPVDGESTGSAEPGRPENRPTTGNVQPPTRPEPPSSGES